MAGKDLIIDWSEFDLERPIADKAELQKYIPQRHEMAQLDAVVFESLERLICVGYKDLTNDEFWVRGHMPGFPIMPGVVMCEVAAQLSSYFVGKYDLLGAKLVGLGGLEEIRFRNVVKPGDRLVIMLTQIKLRKGAVIVCKFQGYVNQSLVVEGQIKGVPIPTE